MSLDDLFGSGRELTALQMSVRAFVCFFTLLALTRLAGMRAFGRKSTFDVVIVITLGAVLVRMIGAARRRLARAADDRGGHRAGALHRIIAVVTAAVPVLERIIKGDSHVIYRGGIFDLKRMRRAGISHADIEQAVRKHANQLTLREVLEVRLEPTGELTVIEDEVGRRNRAERNKGLGVPAGAPV